MIQIFVSYSKEDPNIDFFHGAFSGAQVGAVWMGMEDPRAPPRATIKEKITLSRAVFAALSRPLLDSFHRHTQNWIDFEVGLACPAKQARMGPRTSQ